MSKRITVQDGDIALTALNGNLIATGVSEVQLSATTLNFDGTLDVDGAAHEITTDSMITLSGSGETLATFVDDGPVTLYFDDVAAARTALQGSGAFEVDKGAGFEPVLIESELPTGTPQNGTVNDSVLRWEGSAWVEETGVLIASGGSTTFTSFPTLPGSSPSTATDAAHKEYVDSVAAGLDPKESARVATTGDLGATYNATGGPENSGQFTGAPTTIDSISLAEDDRVLVKDQTDATENGIYIVTATTSTWNRAPDHDGTPSNEVSAGNFVFIEAGTTNQSTGWVLVGDGILTLNTDDINWVQFAGAGTFTGGDGIDVTGTTIAVDSTVVRESDNPASLTSVSIGAGQTISDSNNVALLDASPANFTGTLQYGGIEVSTVDASTLTTGTLSDNRLSSNVALLNSSPDFDDLSIGSGQTITNSDNIELVNEGTVQTTDATQTELLAYSVPTDTSVGFEVSIIGREDATGDTVFEKIFGLISNEAGTTALIGSTIVDRNDSTGASGWTITVAADDGTDELTIDVTGEAAHTIDWRARLKVLDV